MSDDRPDGTRVMRHAGDLRAAAKSVRRAQLDDLVPAAAAPEAWLDSEPAWSIAALK